MTEIISIQGLLIGFVPVLIVLGLMWHTGQGLKKPAISLGRMLLQLTLVGYVLLLIFDNAAPWLTGLILFIMLLIASWIALNVSQKNRFSLFTKALVAIFIGSGTVLLVVTQGVIQIDPWYNPRYMLPLAGMIFSSGMTAISLSLERFEAECGREDLKTSLNLAFKAAMIPIVNSMLAVGVVSLPGMMTGQILAGIEPYVAARYQIMVMCMIFSATGMTVFVFLKLLASDYRNNT